MSAARTVTVDGELALLLEQYRAKGARLLEIGKRVGRQHAAAHDRAYREEMHAALALAICIDNRLKREGA